ncbi:hypothetical protein [Ruminococcus sp.]|uniref:hypothetical protein n=1 Tax=Ruminococcus sp. TaxID=41978 RepID=UPI0025F81574|nr:hypothetical protein [Ruminococcus sp.]MBQ6250167.1 hypothetical protein [Ruminococcus sp.]
MYRTIVYFEDLQDDSHPYNVGDVYPREGFTPSDKRIKELATDKNIRGIPLIKKEERKPKKK